MEDVLEWCLGSSDNKSYDSSNEDLLIVSRSSQSVNDAQKDGYNAGAISNVLNLYWYRYYW